MIKSFTRSKPHRDKNDDISGYHGNVFWLMDGATQLVQPAHGKDVSWHVNALDKAFREALQNNPDIELPDLARRAVLQVAEEFYKASGLTLEASQELRPYATLVMSRLSPSKDYLDYLIVCDSTLAVVGPDQETVLSDPRIDATQPLAKAFELLRTGHDFQSEAYKEEMRNIYKDTHRRLKNIDPDGFDVVGQDPSMIDRALKGHVALGPQDHVLLMSDGFTRAVDMLDIYKSYTDLKQSLETQGGEFIIDQIRASESADPAGRNHLRSSIHDDATLLWIQP